MPELPEGMPAPRGGWKLSTPEDRNRRSVYIFVRRNSRYPMLQAFDMPDTHESCGRRDTTITAPQALSLLNGKVSSGLGSVVCRARHSRGRSRTRAEIDRAYFACLFATSRSDRTRHGDDVCGSASSRSIAKRQARRQKDCASRVAAVEIDDTRGAALVDFCHMLLNSNEFVYRN